MQRPHARRARGRRARAASRSPCPALRVAHGAQRLPGGALSWRRVALPACCLYIGRQKPRMLLVCLAAALLCAVPPHARAAGGALPDAGLLDAGLLDAALVAELCDGAGLEFATEHPAPPEDPWRDWRHAVRVELCQAFYDGTGDDWCPLEDVPRRLREHLSGRAVILMAVTNLKLNTSFMRGTDESARHAAMARHEILTEESAAFRLSVARNNASCHGMCILPQEDPLATTGRWRGASAADVATKYREEALALKAQSPRSLSEESIHGAFVASGCHTCLDDARVQGAIEGCSGVQDGAAGELTCRGNPLLKPARSLPTTLKAIFKILINKVHKDNLEISDDKIDLFELLLFVHCCDVGLAGACTDYDFVSALLNGELRALRAGAGQPDHAMRVRVRLILYEVYVEAIETLMETYGHDVFAFASTDYLPIMTVQEMLFALSSYADDICAEALEGEEGLSNSFAATKMCKEELAALRARTEQAGRLFQQTSLGAAQAPGGAWLLLGGLIGLLLLACCAPRVKTPGRGGRRGRPRRQAAGKTARQRLQVTPAAAAARGRCVQHACGEAAAAATAAVRGIAATASHGLASVRAVLQSFAERLAHCSLAAAGCCDRLAASARRTAHSVHAAMLEVVVAVAARARGSVKGPRRVATAAAAAARAFLFALQAPDAEAKGNARDQPWPAEGSAAASEALTKAPEPAETCVDTAADAADNTASAADAASDVDAAPCDADVNIAAADDDTTNAPADAAAADAVDDTDADTDAGTDTDAEGTHDEDELERYYRLHRECETRIEQGAGVAINNEARMAACDAHICRLSGGADVSSRNRAAVKALKAALAEKENPEGEDLASMLRELILSRACDGCGASARAEGVKLSVCTRCRQAFFCSMECLERSWEAHEPDCTRLQKKRKKRQCV